MSASAAGGCCPANPSRRVLKKKPDFDPKKFLATIGEGRQVVLFVKKQTILAQGDVADAVFYIQEGKVRLTVVTFYGAACQNFNS
jgi:CRP-like cAMP-binding protein